MLNPQEASIEIRNYLDKLSDIINKKASFTLINVKIINKNLIDDILCCIEASFPDDFIKYEKKFGKKLRSRANYLKLKEKIQNKFFFSSSCYAVRFNETAPIIRAIKGSLEADMRYLYSDQSGMF